MKTQYFQLFLLICVFVAGCSNEERDYRAAMDRNITECYQSFLQKYPNSKHSAEIRYLTALSDGSWEAYASYLWNYKNWNNEEWMNEVRDSLTSSLDRASADELIQGMKKTENSVLIEEIEDRLWSDEASAWTWIEELSKKEMIYTPQETKEAIDAYQKYVSLYKRGPHFASAKQKLKELSNECYKDHGKTNRPLIEDEEYPDFSTIELVGHGNFPLRKIESPIMFWGKKIGSVTIPAIPM